MIRFARLWGATSRATHKKGNKKWVAGVKTDSTYCAPGLFRKSPTRVARAGFGESVAERAGIGDEELTDFVNRGGRGLALRRELRLRLPVDGTTRTARAILTALTVHAHRNLQSAL
jgi:hypothetical protein